MWAMVTPAYVQLSQEFHVSLDEVASSFDASLPGLAAFTTSYDFVRTTDTPNEGVVSLCTSAIFTLEYGFGTAQNVYICSPPKLPSES